MGITLLFAIGIIIFVASLMFGNFNKVDTSSNVSSFNLGLETYAGTSTITQTELELDTVVTSNKKNKEHQIGVTYDNKTTYDSTEIINIKHKLSNAKKYEIVLDYDSNGYINNISVSEI